jgi:succinate dehydrogenase / fumarate reductase, cytochrome b subunit
MLFRNMLKTGRIFSLDQAHFRECSCLFVFAARGCTAFFACYRYRQSSYSLMSIMAQTRPKHLNLMQIRLPLPAFVSILHRVSGAILFLLLPLLLCVMASSLESPQSFAEFRKWVAHPLSKILLIGVLWAYLHHFCAGIRHLMMDMHIGLELESARASSYAVLGISLVLTALIGWKLW